MDLLVIMGVRTQRKVLVCWVRHCLMGSSTLGLLGNSYVVGTHGPLFLRRVIKNEEIPIWVPPMSGSEI